MSKYKTLTQENFEREVILSDRPVLVDFWADWCGPCHAVAPVIEELAAEFDGQAVVGKVDVEANQALAAQYGIRAIPTLLFFQDGKPVEQLSGAQPKKVLAAKLEQLVAGNAIA